MKKWIKIAAWTLFALGTLVLLAFGRFYQLSKEMSAPEITLSIQDGIALINETEIETALINENLYYEGITQEELDIKSIESFLKNRNEIDQVDVYTQLSNNWFINAKIKRPLARIILPNKDDFYLDNNGKVMGLSPYAKPRILTFTGLSSNIPIDVKYTDLINNDSLITKYKLSDSYRISRYVCNDDFYDALIVQVHYTKEDGFVLTPRLGNHQIIFGHAESAEEVTKKFEKLTTFYEEVIPYEGWDKYKTIDLRFKNQIVAKKK